MTEETVDGTPTVVFAVVSTSNFDRPNSNTANIGFVIKSAVQGDLDALARSLTKPEDIPKPFEVEPHISTLNGIYDKTKY